MLITQLKDVLNDPHLEKIETVQMLWSNYGEIARYFSPAINKHVIVKYIDVPNDPKHPRGWNTPLSHHRKLTSYQVEKYFYQHYSSNCKEAFKVPKLITSLTMGEQLCIVMEDLNDAGYFIRLTDINIEQMKLVIRWLANFHGYFLHSKTEGLWQQGSYWHLATRPDELAAMVSGPLKDNAGAIDHQLSNAKYKTLVHGDAKLANFCFYHDVTKVAAVDFQYVGNGVGVQDLAYFLGSCLSNNDLFHYQDELLSEYFSHLNIAIDKYHPTVNSSLVLAEWQELYKFSWADFNRFLQGWSPSHFKINGYMQRQTDDALTQLK